MFTSRAEYRLLLRQDNADLRLSGIGFEAGLLPRYHYEAVRLKQETVAAEVNRLKSTRIGGETLSTILSRPGSSYSGLPNRDCRLTEDAARQVEIAVKYEGYIGRQAIEVERFKSLEDKQIPDWIDYATISSLRVEAKQKLGKVRPATIGQASRISGVSASDIGVILVCMKRGQVSPRLPSVDLGSVD